MVLVPSATAQTNITELGKAIRSSVNQDQLVSYKLYTSLLNGMTSNDYLTFALSPLSGDADLFISTAGVPSIDSNKHCTNCILQGSTPHAEIKDIQKSDSNWPTGTDAAFYIGVYGYSASDFLLNVFSTNMNAVLDLGVTQIASTYTGQYTYFKYQLDDSSNFSIAVTPMNGDPDIFVSASTERPVSGNSEWNASLYGFDMVRITTDNVHYKAQGLYGIGIYAFFNTYYTISVSKHDTYVEMIEGLSLSNFVDGGTYTYFKFTLKNAGHRLIMILNALTTQGDPDIYVTTDISTGPPSRTNYQWSSASFGGDVVTIENAQATTYYIGIYGYAYGTKFQLSVNTERRNLLLNDGVAQPGYAGAGQYSFYKFAHGDSQSALSVVVSPNQGQSVELYAALDNTHPDANKHQYVGIGLDTSDRHITWPIPSQTGTYYFGVYSQNGANYTITAQTQQTATVLIDGVTSYYNSVPTGYYRYFVFDASQSANASDRDVSIVVHPTYGDADLYVSTTIERPTSSNYTWKSDNWRQDTVVVLSNDTKKEGKNVFYIGVYGASFTGRSNGFSITALLSGTTVELREGAISSGVVSPGKYTYYEYVISNSGSININLELTSGDDEADIYVSTSTTKPTKDDYQYKSTRIGNDYLNIKNARPGAYYIGVYGVRGASSISYSLMARQNYQSLPTNSFSLLEVADAGSNYTFHTNVYNDTQAVLLATTLIFGRTNMYISTDVNKIPNKDNADYVSTTWPGNAIFIPRSDSKFKPGEWLIVIEHVEDSNYFIGASSVPGTTWLREGIPRLAIAPKQEHIMFAYWIPFDNQVDYYLNIRIMTGLVNVYAGQDWQDLPSPQNHTWASEGPNDRLIKLEREKLEFGYILFISVYGSDDDSYFELTLSKNTTTRYLVLDQPQIQLTTVGGYSYFKIYTPQNTEHELDFIITSCEAAPAPIGYLSDNPQIEHPTKDNSTFATKVTKNPYVQYVKTPKKKNSQYNAGILVGNKDAKLYSVYATTSTDTRPVVKNPYFKGNPPKNSQMLLIIDVADPPKKYADRTFRYTVYMRDLTNNTAYNFDTACGIQYYGQELGTAEVTSGSKTVQYLVDIDLKKDYVVNVIVSDNLGLSTPYKYAFIKKGVFVPHNAPSTMRGISVGAVFILLATIALLSYFLIGACYNIYKGERGIAIIPNHTFWLDLPHLLLDGLKFIATCGRVSRDYERFDHAPVEEPSRGSNQIQESSGYGSI